jgi:hypothetical protein
MFFSNLKNAIACNNVGVAVVNLEVVRVTFTPEWW